MTWSLTECRDGAWANAPGNVDIIIAHHDTEGFVWCQRGGEWTYGVTDEDIIEVLPALRDSDPRHECGDPLVNPNYDMTDDARRSLAEWMEQ